MSQPSNIPDLQVPETAPADAQEFARCLENAADMVQEFAEYCAPTALEALLGAAETEDGGLERARGLADNVTKQAETLYAEVERFLSLGKFG